MKKVLVFSLILGLISCSSNEKNSSNHSIQANDSYEGKSKVSAGKVDKEAAKAAAEKYNVANTTTTIKFDEYFYDFGSVFKSSSNKHIFRFKNIGNAPCIIQSAKASCGCTIPKKPEKPVLPGEYGELEVVFKPKPSQKGEINKTVTVVANTIPNPIELKIRANVSEGMGG